MVLLRSGPESGAPGRHQCGDCGQFVPEASVLGYRDFESGVMEATGTCSRCGVVDVFRAAPRKETPMIPVTPETTPDTTAGSTPAK